MYAVVRLSRMCNKEWKFPILLGRKAWSNFLPVSDAPPFSAYLSKKDSLASIERPKKSSALGEFVKSFSGRKDLKLTDYIEAWNKMDTAEKERFRRMAVKRNEELAKQPKWKQQLWSLVEARKAADKKERLKELIAKKLGKPKVITGHNLFVRKLRESRAGRKSLQDILEDRSLTGGWRNLAQAERDKYIQAAKRKNSESYALFEKNVLEHCPELYWEVLPKAKRLLSEAQKLKEEKERAAIELNAAAKELDQLKEICGDEIDAMQRELGDLNDEIRTLNNNIQAAKVKLNDAVKLLQRSSNDIVSKRQRLESAHS